MASPCPHSLALRHSPRSPPVSIPDASNTPYFLFRSRPRRSYLFVPMPLSSLSTRPPLSSQSPELSFPQMGSKCAEIPPPLVQAVGQPLTGQLGQSNPIPDPPSTPNKCGHFLTETGKHCPKAHHLPITIPPLKSPFHHLYLYLYSRTCNTPLPPHSLLTKL